MHVWQPTTQEKGLFCAAAGYALKTKEKTEYTHVSIIDRNGIHIEYMHQFDPCHYIWDCLDHLDPLLIKVTKHPDNDVCNCVLRYTIHNNPLFTEGQTRAEAMAKAIIKLMILKPEPLSTRLQLIQEE